MMSVSDSHSISLLILRKCDATGRELLENSGSFVYNAYILYKHVMNPKRKEKKKYRVLCYSMLFIGIGLVSFSIFLFLIEKLVFAFACMIIGVSLGVAGAVIYRNKYPFHYYYHNTDSAQFYNKVAKITDKYCAEITSYHFGEECSDDVVLKINDYNDTTHVFVLDKNNVFIDGKLATVSANEQEDSGLSRQTVMLNYIRELLERIEKNESKSID